MHWLYQALKYQRDVNSVRRAARARSARPVVRRVARRAYGKATGRLARKLFG